MCRGLVLPLVLDAGHDKHQDGDHVRGHGDELLCGGAEAWYQDAADVETAEEEGAEDAQHRFPQRKDYDGYCQPAPVAKAVVGPGAASVVHYPVEATQSRYDSADYSGEVLILGHVYTGGIGSGRVLAHSPHVEAGSGPVEVEAYRNGDDHRQVSQEAEIQERNHFGLVPPSDGEERYGAAVTEEAEE